MVVGKGEYIEVELANKSRIAERSLGIAKYLFKSLEKGLRL